MVAIGLHPTPTTVAITEAARKLLNYTLTRPGREMLFTVVTQEEKYKAKVTIDTVVQRLGDAAAAGVFRLFSGLLLGPAGVALCTVPLCVVWGIVGLSLGARQHGLARAQAHAPARGPDAHPDAQSQSQSQQQGDAQAQAKAQGLAEAQGQAHGQVYRQGHVPGNEGQWEGEDIRQGQAHRSERLHVARRESGAAYAPLRRSASSTGGGSHGYSDREDVYSDTGETAPLVALRAARFGKGDSGEV